MAADESSGGESDRGSIMGGLLAPLRLPEHALRALDLLADAAAHVGPMRTELERVREQVEPLAELGPSVHRLEQGLERRLDELQRDVTALEGYQSHLNESVGALTRETAAMHKTLATLREDVRRVTTRMPDPEARGPIEKARDVLTGGGE